MTVGVMVGLLMASLIPVIVLHIERARWERRYVGRHRVERVSILETADLLELVALCRVRLASLIWRADR